MKSDTSSAITTLKGGINQSNLNNFVLGILLVGERIAATPLRKQIFLATARHLESYSVARTIKLQNLHIQQF
jgi:hypothetical protein